MKQKNYLWLLFLLLGTSFLSAQNRFITGTITAQSDGMPLPGVTVLIKGTTNGTQTDFDGKFSIQAKTGDVLLFTYVGMKATEITVGKSNTINVAMLEDVSALEEVVITGYTSMAREKSSAAVSMVSGESVRDVPIATFEQLLQGRAAGVQVSSGSGQPGIAATVTIRGQNSINGNTTPLYIVDGIQIDAQSFASLNPNDFETYSVLKDAQAKSIYGSRAAAGVIVITTKSGRKGEPTIQYRTYTGWSEAPELGVDILNAQQFYEVSRFYGVNDAGGLTDIEIAENVAALDGFNVRDALLRVGQTTNHEFTISGGSEKVQYFTSAGYFEQEGTVQGSDLQRMTTRTNLTFNASDRLKVDLRTSLGFSRFNLPSGNGGTNLGNPFLTAFTGNPITPVFREDGSYNTGNGLSFALPNILEDVATGIRETEEFKLVASANIDYQVTDHISLNYNVGIDFEDDFQINALSPESFRGQTLPDLGDAGEQNEQNRRDLFFTSTLRLQYQNTFADKHDVTMAAFVEAVRRDFRSSEFTGYQLEPNLFGFANAITPGTVDNELIPAVGGDRFITGLFSVFANGSYLYDDKYGLDFSVRQDQSSRVAVDNADAVFYSVGLRWNIHNEAFMQNVDWINSLKLRGSFGTSGNDASVGANEAFQQLGTGLFQGEQTLVRTGIANGNISWEIQEDLNLGLDFGLFNNSLRGSVDWYKNVTKDLIIPFNVSAAFGAGVVAANAGTLENTGVEVDLKYDLVNSGDWYVGLNFNGAYNYGEVTDLGDQVDQFEDGTSLVRVGEQLGAQFVVPFVGVNPANGDPLYLDLEGNVTSQFSDGFARTGFGSDIPLYQGGFGFDVAWKGLSLSTLFVYQAEMTRFNNTLFFMENLNLLGGGLNQSVTILDAWREPGDITNMPRLTANREFSSADLEQADFLRLRNIQLAYNLPSKHLERLPISGLRVYAQGVNLLTWTKFTGLDPEDNNNITAFEYPNPRTVTVGLDLSF